MGRAWLLAAGSAAPQMYRWTGDDGNLHITDYPPPGGGGKPMNRDAIRIDRIESGAAGRPAPAAPGRNASPPLPTAPPAREYPRVAVYGADW